MRTANPMPDLHIVKEAFEHNSDGTFTWKERPIHHFPDLRAMRIWNTKYSGKIAVGSVKKNGYIYFSFSKKNIAAHRLAWYFHNGSCDPKMEIDHRNGIRNDNRIENLRLSTSNNNQHNKPMQKNNSSGFKNVVWNKRCGKWQVKLRSTGKDYHIGLFDDINKANEAAIIARSKIHDSYANHGEFQSSENSGEA